MPDSHTEFSSSPKEALGHLEKSQRVNFWKKNNEMRQTIEEGRWMIDPEDELSPIFEFDTWEQDGYQKSDFVDLKDLKPNTTVYFFATNSHAFYTIKIVEGGKIKIWRDRAGQTTGLVTDAGNLGVFDQTSMDDQTNEVNYYSGCLASSSGTRKQPRISIPIFNYERYESQRGRVMPPTPGDNWMDFIKEIYVKQAK